MFNSSSSLVQIIFIFLITIAIAYIFGFILVDMVNKRLNTIRNEMPYQFERLVEKFENSNSKKDKIEQKNELIQSISLESKTNKDGYREYKNLSDDSENIVRFDNEYYENMNPNNIVSGFDAKDTINKDIEWSPSTNKSHQACFKDHEHDKSGKRDGCNYGLTNYADPKDMTQIDYNIYILNYPPNFTLQDYVNWLWCYKNKKEKLPYNHLRNLEKLELGKELKVEPGVLPPPSYYFPSLNAEDYFNTLYNTENEFNTAPHLNSTTASMIGYNYNQYSEFSQNSDVYGTSGELRNPDIGLKKTAREVDDYIIPHDSQNLNIEKKYKPYHVKKVEI